ncbi:MAG: hypothetical protein QM695_12380 [Micropruina sp.]
MPKPKLENYADADETTQFVLQWNDWSTDIDRQKVYRAAWKEANTAVPKQQRKNPAPGQSWALAFLTAVADAKAAELGESPVPPHVPVPKHIQDYLKKHVNFSATFRRAFRRVRDDNWRLAGVVDQTNLETFSPAVTRLENRRAKVVMLYVVGDPNV